MELSLIYKWILQLHSLWSILTLSLLVYTTLRFFYKLSKNKIFTSLDLRIALFALIFSSFQFIIGFVLYFISPNLNQWGNPINEIFNNEIYLFNLITSPILNIFGILAISIGWSLFKKAKTNKKAAIKYLIYIPNPLMEVSKFSIGLFIRLDLPHRPLTIISQQRGIPKKKHPVLLRIHLVLCLNPA